MNKKRTWVDKANEHLTIETIGKTVVGVAALFAAIWGFEAHYETRKDAEIAQAWTRYSLRNNRLEYLSDKQAECDQYRAAGTLSGVPANLCERYKTQIENVTKEVADLKTDATKAGNHSQ